MRVLDYRSEKVCVGANQSAKRKRVNNIITTCRAYPDRKDGRTMASGSYNGWKNWETWAADLWIDNEESNYRLEMEYFQRCERRHVLPTYTGFLRFAGCGFYNGDLSPKNSRICRAEITKRMREDFKDWQEHSA